MATIEDDLTTERPRRGLRRVLIALGVLVLAVVAYYVGGALWLHHIDDDPDFAAQLAVPDQASRAVAVSAALIDREVNQHRWVANDPAFLPGYLLDNMPAYETGIMQALGRFATELRDRLARVRGSSAVDPDVESAAGRLNYPGDVWIFEWSNTPVQPSSESQYRRGMADLRRYNERLAQGQAVLERRADNLMATLDRISDDLGAASAALTREVDLNATRLFDPEADDLFYNVKGKLYAYYLILRAFEADFANVVKERNLQASWADLLNSARLGATLHPWMVSNGPLDSQAVPNHLAAQGFLLLRVRTKLEEIIDILQT
ncbi:DUF2333 family protein [Benzoatithermus flavus]|uniref:DUF2333 family protein n=1 Tax=Benzoatithermus flavus TaxID=3108223 RepID=A0ABU8XUS3_9PROT